VVAVVAADQQTLPLSVGSRARGADGIFRRAPLPRTAPLHRAASFLPSPEGVFFLYTLLRRDDCSSALLFKRAATGLQNRIAQRGIQHSNYDLLWESQIEDMERGW
jgi:hypothetical protein